MRSCGRESSSSSSRTASCCPPKAKRAIGARAAASLSPLLAVLPKKNRAIGARVETTHINNTNQIHESAQEITNTNQRHKSATRTKTKSDLFLFLQQLASFASGAIQSESNKDETQHLVGIISTNAIKNQSINQSIAANSSDAFVSRLCLWRKGVSASRTSRVQPGTQEQEGSIEREMECFVWAQGA
jgi:hypothetical protein